MDDTLTDEQKKELGELFLYDEQATIGKEDLAWARKTFKKPEDFQRLRRVLQLFVQQERGITAVNPQSMINAPITDMQAYAIETAVNNLAEERVRTSLFSLYRMLRGDIVNERKDKMVEANKESKEEEEKLEAKREELAKEQQRFGDNL